MDKVALGHRVAQAREAASLTQESLGRAVGLDRSAVSRLEKGDRKLNVTELVDIASALKRPLAYFVSDTIPAVVSRRSDTGPTHESSTLLDTELEQFASDLQSLVDAELLEPAHVRPIGRTPISHEQAEILAQKAREAVSLGLEPISDLGDACELFGLVVFAASLGELGADGGCVEVSAAPGSVGAAVINGDAPAGRRRMTLAHELGHWLVGDAYDAGTSADSERMISSFAVHFLAPRASVTRTWSDHSSWSMRDRAIAVAVKFRLSWSAAIGQLRNLSLINYDDHSLLSRERPRQGEYLRLKLSWSDELASPYLSPRYAATVVEGFLSHKLTEARTLELLRGTLEADDLPPLSQPAASAFLSAFEGHDG